MRIAFAPILVGLSACVSYSPGGPPSDREAELMSTVSVVLALIDQRCFEHVSPYYDDAVLVDYSSLWGGAERALSNQEVVEGWAGFLPGFDVTYHRLHSFVVQTNEDHSDVFARVEASHWLDDKFWWISGAYSVRLRQKEDQGWVITAWRFDLDQEKGDRSLVDEAEQRVFSDGRACPISD